MSLKHAEDVVRRVDSQVDRMSLLKHPFYQLWSNGSLTPSHLRGYSKEYFHLVRSVPALVDNVRRHALLPSDRDVIGESVSEERSHIEMWEKFAEGIGVKPAELRAHSCSRATKRAVTQLERLTNLSFEEGAAAMYAYESELPRISRSKIEGLEKFYGITAPDALRYFTIHETVDVKHAAIWRGIMRRSAASQRPKLVDAASASMAALNGLLTGIQEEYVNLSALHPGGALGGALPQPSK